MHAGLQGNHCAACSRRAIKVLNCQQPASFLSLLINLLAASWCALLALLWLEAPLLGVLSLKHKEQLHLLPVVLGKSCHLGLALMARPKFSSCCMASPTPSTESM